MSIKNKDYIFAHGCKYNLPDNYEMREILSHWNRLYPNKSLAITGPSPSPSIPWHE